MNLNSFGKNILITYQLGYDRQKSPELNKVPLDAHHIIEKTHDNYISENGIAVCSDCHLKCEKFHITNHQEWEPGFHPDDLFKMIS